MRRLEPAASAVTVTISLVTNRKHAPRSIKLRGVEVSETVCRLHDRTRLAEVTWKTLSVVSLILPSIGHVGSDVHQTSDRWIRPRFGNYGSPVAKRDKNAGSILKSKD